VLLEQNYAQHSFVKMAQFKFMSYWGTYTYGLYCLHYLCILVAIQVLHRLGLNTTPVGVVLGDNATALLLALVLSWVSYNFYEKPFLKLKKPLCLHYPLIPRSYQSFCSSITPGP